MTYRRRRRWLQLPDPATRQSKVNVINKFATVQKDLGPAPAPVHALRAAGVLDRMSAIRRGQAIPMIGERVSPDADPNVRNS